MRWYYVLMCLFFLLSGRTSERDVVAPIVLPNIIASVCALSTSHQYLIAQAYDPELMPNQDYYQVEIFDLTTTLTVTIPITNVELADPPSMRWYANDVVLLDQRWFYDIPHGIVTDTATLSGLLPPNSYNYEVPQWNPSPDGRLVASGARIWQRDPVTGERGAVVVDLPSTFYTDGCINGWSADSRSYYFLDWEIVGPRQYVPGPIRKITLP